MSAIISYAVIVAAGKGTRMGMDMPKQFINFHGKPLMCYAVEAFAAAIPDIKLVLVVPPSHVSNSQIVMKSYLPGLEVMVVPGGETRYHSVQNGLKHVKNDGVVFVHDGARPLVSVDLIRNCYEQALKQGSAIPAIPVVESVRLITENNESKSINRDQLRIVQTPQTFRTEVILPAFKQSYLPSFTDEATVVEAYDLKVYLIDGAIDNIKITTQEDLARAEAIYAATN